MKKSSLHFSARIIPFCSLPNLSISLAYLLLCIPIPIKHRPKHTPIIVVYLHMYPLVIAKMMLCLDFFEKST